MGASNEGIIGTFCIYKNTIENIFGQKQNNYKIDTDNYSVDTTFTEYEVEESDYINNPMIDMYFQGPHKNEEKSKNVEENNIPFTGQCFTFKIQVKLIYWKKFCVDADTVFN